MFCVLILLPTKALFFVFIQANDLSEESHGTSVSKGENSHHEDGDRPFKDSEALGHHSEHQAAEKTAENEVSEQADQQRQRVLDINEELLYSKNEQSHPSQSSQAQQAGEAFSQSSGQHSMDEEGHPPEHLSDTVQHESAAEQSLDQQQQHHQEQEEQQQPYVEESHEDRSDDLISDTPHSTGDGVLSVDVDEQAQGSVSNEKEEVAGERVQTELLPTKTIAWPEEENPSATRPEDNEKGEVYSEIVFVS